MAFKCSYKILRTMSKTTWNERLVILILSLGTLLAFNGIMGKVTGYDFSLISVRINGLDALGDPDFLLQTRLRTEITIDVTWSMYYEAPLQQGRVYFSLYNSVTSIENSTVFTDCGSAIHHMWTFSLLPQEWDMNGRREYGKIVIFLEKFDGVACFSEHYDFPILVFPEEVSCVYMTKYFKNDTGGRMDHLKLTYFVTSMQNSSYHHPGLGFKCEIFNNRNETLDVHDFYVNIDGFLELIIEKELLIYLENNSIKLQNHQSTQLEPVLIERSLDEIISRTDMIVYYKNITENSSNGTSTFVLSFDTSIVGNISSAIGQDLYLDWKLVDSSEREVDSGNFYIRLESVFVLTVNSDFTRNAEVLKFCVWIEGNFFLKSKKFDVILDSLLDRDDVDVDYLGLQEFQGNVCGILSFIIKNTRTSTPLNHHDAKVTIYHCGNASIFQEFLRITDGDGQFNITISQEALELLEFLRIEIQSISTLRFKECTLSLLFSDLCTRVQPEIGICNETTGLVLEKNERNTIRMNIFVNGSGDANFSECVARIFLLDEKNRSLYDEFTRVDQNGNLEFELPVDLLHEKQRLTIHVIMNSTFKSKPLAFSAPLYILKINDYRAPFMSPLVVIFTSITFIGIGFLIFLIIIKKHKKSFLTKNKFTISIKN